MSRTLRVLAVLLGLVGIVWFLQGIGVIQGSMMTSQTKWAVIGGVMIAVAIVTLLFGARLKR